MKRYLAILISIFVLAVIVAGVFFYLIFSATPAPVSTEILSPRTLLVTDAPRYKNSIWGIMVVDLATGKPLIEFNADKRFCPASTTKLYTMAAALDTFGARYRFKTPVYVKGKVNSRGVLNGDLILVASGDLTLGGRTTKNARYAYTNMDHTDAGMDGAMSAVLTDTDPLAGIKYLAKRVAGSGIKTINGEIIVDDRLFEKSVAGGGFIRTPVVVNDNLMDLIIKPRVSGEAASIEARPVTTTYKIKNMVRTVRTGEALKIEVLSQVPGEIMIRGKIPQGSPPCIRNYPVESPSSFARTLFIEALKREKIKVNAFLFAVNPVKKLPSREAYAKLKQVAVYTSLPFSETVKVILKVSHNLGADITPLLIAAKKGKKTFQAGMNIEREILKRMSVEVDSISLSDGEGGAIGDYLTPRAGIALLSTMAKGPDFKAYHDALPILGVDGTLAGMVSPESPARGKVFAKTGTFIAEDLLNNRGLLRSKALAGYMTSATGKQLAFVIYVNNASISSSDDILVVGKDVARVAELVYEEN